MRHPRVAVSAALALCVLGAGASVTGSAIGSVGAPASPTSLTDAVLPSVELRGDALALAEAPPTPFAVAQARESFEVPWSTRGVAADAIAGDTLTWDVVKDEGPGRVVVDAEGIAAETEGVTTWEFTRPGTYELTVRASADLVGGGTSSGTETYRVLVAAPEAVEPTVTPSDESASRPADAQPADPKPMADQEPSTPSVEPELPDLRVAPLSGASTPVATAPKRPSTAPKARKRATASQPVVLDDVHIDIAARMSGGKLSVKVKDGTDPGAPVYREPGVVVLHAKPASRIEIPANSAYRFLGPAGKPAWVLPQTQATGLLWPGWNTETVTSADLKGGITWKLVGVDGPGDFSIFLNNSFGTPSVLFDSGDGLPDSMKIPLGTHAHGNWAFTEQGVYRLTVEMSGTTPGGATVSDREVISFAVGNADPTTVTGTSGSGGTGGSGGGGSDSAADGELDAEPLDGSSSGATGGSSSGLSGALATTGAATLTALALAAGLLAAGVGLVLVGRRRSALR